MTNALRALLRDADTLGTLNVRGDSAAFHADCLDRMETLRVLRRGANSADVRCPGCDYDCVVRPQRRTTATGREVIVIPCLEREDVGLVTIDAARLRTWRLDLKAIGELVAEALALRGGVQERVDGRCWELGTRTVDGQRRTFFLAWGLGRPESIAAAVALDQATMAPGPVILVPDAVASVAWKPTGPVLPLSRLLDVDDGGLRLDVEAILSVLAGAKPPKGAPLRPFPTPPGAAWGNVVIRVVDNEHVELVLGATCETRSYRELGMADARKKDAPDEVWALLLVFARVHGALTWLDPQAKRTIPQKLSRLRARLREAFGIEGDPFRAYNNEGGWEARFTIRDAREA